MAEKTLNTRIKLKYDTYTNWVEKNPVLKAGEFAATYVGNQCNINSDNKTLTNSTSGTIPAGSILLKVGNANESNYNALPFVSAIPATIPTDSIDIPYVVCDTAGDEQYKVLTIDGFELSNGRKIVVKFTNTNTAANPYFVIINGGSTNPTNPIYYRGSAIPKSALTANGTYTFVYNGNQWDLVGDMNQNAFSNITVGSTTISADSTTDTLTLVGSNVTITPDAENDKVTIGITKANVTSALGYTPPTTDTTYSAATQSTSGLMSADDKKKLDGIAANANNYSHPTYTARTGKPATNATPGFGGTFTVSQITSDSTGHVTGATDRTVTIPNATATKTTLGLMSPTDKEKLDGITESADAVSFSASATSGNKVGTITINGTATDMYSPMQETVSKLATARSIALGTGATGTATNFDGSSNITIPVTSVKESYLEWGGKDISGGFTPLDAALIEELSANRLAGLSSSRVKFERSSDGGSTWTTYTGNADLITTSGSASNANTTSSQSIYNWHRITINVAEAIYCVLKKIAIYLSTNGATGCKCKIEWGDYSSSTVWTTAKIVDISGWPSWNIINVSRAIGSPSYDKTKYVRLTFSQTGVDLNHDSQLLVYKIRFYSGNCWSAPNNFAETGHVYSYDASLNATFPASVNATSLKENGTALSSKYATKSHNQASNTINAMTGYSKPSSTSAIAPSDTLNSAIGKLEKALDGVETLLASI